MQSGSLRKRLHACAMNVRDCKWGTVALPWCHGSEEMVCLTAATAAHYYAAEGLQPRGRPAVHERNHRHLQPSECGARRAHPKDE